jgi:hypothetical protein
LTSSYVLPARRRRVETACYASSCATFWGTDRCRQEPGETGITPRVPICLTSFFWGGEGPAPAITGQKGHYTNSADLIDFVCGQTGAGNNWVLNVVRNEADGCDCFPGLPVAPLFGPNPTPPQTPHHNTTTIPQNTSPGQHTSPTHFSATPVWVVEWWQGEVLVFFVFWLFWGVGPSKTAKRPQTHQAQGTPENDPKNDPPKALFWASISGFKPPGSGFRVSNPKPWGLKPETLRFETRNPEV